jgi:DNA-binding transcriptional ArsR family regulator
VPPRRELSDLAAVRAMAHPRRQQIMRYLAAERSGTSAELARALDLNTGATSYHLRELARHGFVEEVPEQAGGRQRRWRAVATDFRFPGRSGQDADLRAAVDEVTRQSFAADVDALMHWLSEGSGEWADAPPYSRGTIGVTVEEFRAFFEEYIELVNSYARRDEELPADARRVAVRFLAYPLGEDGSV